MYSYVRESTVRYEEASGGQGGSQRRRDRKDGFLSAGLVEDIVWCRATEAARRYLRQCRGGWGPDPWGSAGSLVVVER